MKTDELWQKTEKALTLTAKDRFKQLKQIGFEVTTLFDNSKDLTLQELQQCIKILKVVLKVPADPMRTNKYITKIILQTLSLRGYDNPKIIYKKTFKLNLITPLVVCGDKSYADYYASSLYPTYPIVNEGKIFEFDTECHGLTKLQIRIVDIPEPVLTPNEYKKIVGETPAVIIHVPTGNLVIDSGDISPIGKFSIEIVVTPGNYKCQAFIYNPSKTDIFNDYYYLVLAKTEEEAINHLLDTPRLVPDY